MNRPKTKMRAQGLVIFPDLDHEKKNSELFKVGEEFDAWRVKLSATLKELGTLLSPLFRKKPLWKEAFVLSEKEMDLVDGLVSLSWCSQGAAFYFLLFTFFFFITYF